MYQPQQLRLIDEVGEENKLLIASNYDPEAKVTLFHGDRLTLLEQVSAKGSFKINLGGAVRRPATANSKVVYERTLSSTLYKVG
jgi:hypothetical protein